VRGCPLFSSQLEHVPTWPAFLFGVESLQQHPQLLQTQSSSLVISESRPPDEGCTLPPTHSAQRSSLFAAYTLRCPGTNCGITDVFIRCSSISDGSSSVTRQ